MAYPWALTVVGHDDKASNDATDADASKAAMDPTESLDVAGTELHAEGQLEQQHGKPDDDEAEKVGDEEHATCLRHSIISKSTHTHVS